MTIVIVLGFEILNSCVERMESWSSTFAHQRVREISLIKDAPTGGVLISTVAADRAGVMRFFNSLLGELFYEVPLAYSLIMRVTTNTPSPNYMVEIEKHKKSDP